MKITKQTVAKKLAAYLHRESSLAELVDWAENALMDGDFDAGDAPMLADVVARLGLADVRSFGLTWEDCAEILEELGFEAHVDVIAA
ncbi:MAG TPA: hypothetical protein VFH95_12170 [Candidatus Kapabacteria bacterium]|nr:hypothetical protein [Candidatus Kapabacteria bacterium]